MHLIIKKAVRKFLRLDDTPSSFTAAAGKSARVNSAEDALEHSFPTKIQDAAGVTKVDVEETATEKIVRMDVDSVEAFKLNADGILDLAKQSQICAYRNGNQAFASGDTLKIQFNAEEFDVQNEFDPVTNFRWTAKKAGKYFIHAALVWVNVSATGPYVIYIYKNGAIICAGIFAVSVTAVYPSSSAALTLSLAVNDYIEAYAWQNSGAEQSIYGVRRDCNLTITKIG